jgi:hypothetical protein
LSIAAWGRVTKSSSSLLNIYNVLAQDIQVVAIEQRVFSDGLRCHVFCENINTKKKTSIPKAQTIVPTITVLMDTPEFSQGFVEGLTSEYARFGACRSHQMRATS